MSPTKHSKYEVAAHWAAKQSLRPLTASEQSEFDAWLAADTRNLGAYGRASAALVLPELLNGSCDSSAFEESDTQSSWNRRHIMFAGGAIAAAGVAIVFEVAQPKTLATEIGQFREFVLPDGSVISLNTNSEIAVQFTEQARKVELLKGEALFDVAKSKARPFIVAAGSTEVRAIGTSFSVALLPQRPVAVLVKEGVVELKRTDVPKALPVRASANVRAIVPSGAPIITAELADKELVRNLEWKNGRIGFEHTTLADAANEFARYNELRIIVDPEVSNRTITGLFSSSDPVGFAKSAAAILKLQTEAEGDQIRIFSE